MRVMDFLKSLDEIVDTAISENVDLVLFAGDAYKDRTPAPTFQREWGRRIMKLSRAGIPTLLLIGNHDLSPALGRANALEAFDTLDVPNVRLVDKPDFLGPAELGGVPVQVIALPWISRSTVMANLVIGTDANEVDSLQSSYEQIEKLLKEKVDYWLKEKVDPNLPVVMAAHCSVQGALYGNERTVMLGRDLVLHDSFVKNPRLDYVALGHIHKAQNLNPNNHPPVIYPGSIERIDFGELNDKKLYVIAKVNRGNTTVDWRELKSIRPFIERHVRLKNQERVNDLLREALPTQEKMKGAIVRLIVEFPRDWEALIDDTALREYSSSSFEFSLVKRPLIQARVRLPDNQAIESLSTEDLLNIYWDNNHIDSEKAKVLNKLAENVIRSVQNG